MAKTTKCAMKGCSRPAHAKGLCRTHYDQKKKKAKAPPETAADKCSVSGCKRVAHAQGLCQMHYEARMKGAPGVGGASNKTCCVPGCTSPHHARGYCKSHYGRQLRSKDEGGSSSKNSTLCEIAGCSKVVTTGTRCEQHSQPNVIVLTRSERLSQIRGRHELMHKEIDRIKETFDSEQEDDKD